MTSSALTTVPENGPWTSEDLLSLAEAMKAMGFMMHAGADIDKRGIVRVKPAAIDDLPPPPPSPPAVRDSRSSDVEVKVDKPRAEEPPVANPTLPDLTGKQMSIPTPVTVHCNGDMSPEDFKKCSRIMSLCQNVIQKTIVDAAVAHDVAPAEALKDMGAWVKAYVDFPFPFFNYVDFQKNKYKNDKFSLEANADLVEDIVNIKNVPDLKEAVIKALKKAGGSLVDYQGKSQQFNYFGIITTYNTNEISLRVVSFSMNMKNTYVKTLCGGMESSTLDCEYVTYQFEADKYTLIKMQEKIWAKELDFISEQFLETINAFFKAEIARWRDNVMEVIQKLKKP